ncbi:hypothetical protein C4F50_04690 [Flavobacterium sp. KB82]|uniref:Uncharacterized protein n=2 Tax=Flavobacterium hungaricum TaxID=2082725 RepID=A0ABR9THB8_9FLAO|nr:hypothetical protein [Flavobacterium hungaricum]
METEKIISELIKQNYYDFIDVFGDYTKDQNVIIINTKNNVVFEIMNGSSCRFEDEDNNFWLTIPETLIINDHRYYPKLGNIFIIDEVKYIFNAMEMIVERAYNYFKEFKNPMYGIESLMTCLYLSEITGDRRDKNVVVYQQFKPCVREGIDTYIYSN